MQTYTRNIRDIKILLFGEGETYSYLIKVSFFVKLKICLRLILMSKLDKLIRI